MVGNLAKWLVKSAFRLSTYGMDTGFHMVRFQMYEKIAERLRSLPPVGNSVLSISGSEHLCSLIDEPAVRVTNADYPEHNILRLHAFKDDSFDYVAGDQVLEHIEGSPQRAMDECHRVLRPGGIVIQTTVLFQEIHKAPGDYWRFTPDGLRYLCRDWAEIIAAESWGNKIAFLGLRYIKVPHARWHPIHKIATWNDPQTPITVWIIARK